MLVAVQEAAQYDSALHMLKRSLDNYSSVLGVSHQQTTACRHALAVSYSAFGQNRDAVDHEKIVFNSLKEQFGDTDPRTQDAKKCLTSFAEKAVQQQKSHNLMLAQAETARCASTSSVPAEKPVKAKKNRSRSNKKQCEPEQNNKEEDAAIACTPPSDDDFILVSRRKEAKSEVKNQGKSQGKGKRKQTKPK